MDYLTHKYWSFFLQKDGRFDGRKFESLINSLLPTLGLDLRETKISWDRSRDFEDADKKIWAECKIYKENISIRILSTTLVMAIIDKPNKIYFFSYSKLNDNAVCHLAQFQSSANLPIYIFDDWTLESLILTNKKTLRQYFPDFVLEVLGQKSLLDIRIGFSKDPEIEYCEDTIDDPRDKELYIHSVFSIDIFIRNLDIKNSLEGTLLIQDSDASTSFFLLNKNLRGSKKGFKLTVETGSIFFYRLYFKAVKSGIQNLPQLTFQNDTEQRLLKLNPHKVRVSAIIRTNLIGKKYIEFLHKFKLLIQARHQPVFFNIYGESGTGKSRMIRECTEALLEEEFSVLKYDGEDSKEGKFKDFIRKVFSRVFKLPLVSWEVPGQGLQNEFVFDLLYNEGFEHSNNIAKIVEFLLNGIASKKYGLLIDNIQNFDESTIIFIDSLITRSNEMSIRLVIICCFNTNLLYKDTKNYELFERLKLRGNSGGDTFRNEEVTGFDDAAFDLFLDNCIKPLISSTDFPFSLNYPETTSLFKLKVLNRPLFIEQTLLYLEQEGAIERIDDKFYVSDITKFHEVLNYDFPSNLFDLISRRWEIFKARGNSSENEKYLSVESAVKFLCYFNSIKYIDVLSFGITTETIRVLEQSGFIEIDEREIVTFYHHQLFLFFYKRNRIQPRYELGQYKNYIEENGLTKYYFYQYFILSSKLSLLSDQLVNEANQVLLSEIHYSDFLIEFSKSLFDTLLSGVEFSGINKEDIMRGIMRIGKNIQLFQSMESRHDHLSRAYKYIITHKKEFFSFGSMYFEFIHSYANACITIHKDEEAISILTHSLLDSDKSGFHSDQEKEKCIGKVYNRLCVVYKAVGLNNEAAHYGNLSQKLAVKIGDKDLQVRNYIDLANVYGRKIEFTTLTLDLWRKAVYIYHSNYEELKYQKPMVQLYESQLEILNGSYDHGIELLKDGVRYCEAHSAHFFGVKYLLLQIMAELTFRRDADVRNEKLLPLLFKAKDWAMKYQINRTYWKILLMEGRIYLFQRPTDIHIAAECFVQALDQFLFSVGSAAIEEYNSSVFEHLAWFFRKNSNISLFSRFQQQCEKIKSIEIKGLMSRVLNFSKQEIETFYNLHKPQLVYNDGKFDFPIVG